MTGFWRTWLTVWAWSIGAFGVVLIGAGFAATEGPTLWVMRALDGPGDLTMTPPLRFALALCGAVTLGWSLTMLAALRAAWQLGAAARPVWVAITVTVVGWYVVDSTLSVATGFALNAVSNTVFLIAYLIPVLRCGVLGDGAASTTATR